MSNKYIDFQLNEDKAAQRKKHISKFRRKTIFLIARKVLGAISLYIRVPIIVSGLAMRGAPSSASASNFRLANPTGSIIQAPRVDYLFTLKICNLKKDFA